MLFLEKDLISCSTVVSLQQNSTVTLHTNYAGINDHNNIPRLSFKGFLYAPSHQLPVVWSVHATNNEIHGNCDAHTFDICHSMSYITFNKISVNVGDVWSSTTNMAMIPVRGLYYVTFVLLHAECHLEASLLVNDLATTSIIKTTCGNMGYLMTRERAVLLSLVEEDIVTVKIIKGTFATFREKFLSSFAGILVYPL